MLMLAGAGAWEPAILKFRSPDQLPQIFYSSLRALVALSCRLFSLLGLKGERDGLPRLEGPLGERCATLGFRKADADDQQSTHPSCQHLRETDSVSSDDTAPGW